MEECEDMRMPMKLFSKHIIQQYNLRKHAKNGCVYIEIRKATYGLPQSGRLVNKQLTKFLEPEGYYEITHTPGLWRHKTRPIQFMLVVDNFGVKYVGKELGTPNADWYCTRVRQLVRFASEGCFGKAVPGYADWYTKR